MDMRSALNELRDNEISIFDKDGEYRKMTYDSAHYLKVYVEDLKVGDRLYLHTSDDGYVTSPYKWREIEITHLYGGVIFYKIVDNTDDSKHKAELHMENLSIAVLLNLYPKKVVITKDFEFYSHCPRLEFIYDEDPTTVYSSTYNLSEEKRF